MDHTARSGTTPREANRPLTAFVLGGGGVLGAYEVGMLRALDEAAIRPDLVVGTSVGALNGASLAWEPDTAVERLTTWWSSGEVADVFSGSVLDRVTNLVRTGTALHDNQGLRRLITNSLPARSFDELQVPFQCVAANVERAAAHWFTEGPLVEAMLASSAVPGLLPPVEIDGEHFYDGGLVHSIPIGRAVALGAARVFVLHVGRIEHTLAAPRWPWEVGMVAFEIARRHRFAEEVANVGPEVDLHVLPSGAEGPGNGRIDLRQLRYRAANRVADHIDNAYRASAAYLSDRLSGRRPPA